MATALSSHRRLLALVALALGLWYYRDAFDDSTPASRKVARPRPVASGPASRLLRSPPEDICTVPTQMPQRAMLVARAAANPFVTPPPPAPKVAAVPVAKPFVGPPLPPPPPPPPALPRLPFVYVGQFVDPGHPTTVFLTVGSALINAVPGDVLDGGFRLDSIGPRELVFVHVARNVTLRMPIEGERL